MKRQKKEMGRAKTNRLLMEIIQRVKKKTKVKNQMVKRPKTRTPKQPLRKVRMTPMMSKWKVEMTQPHKAMSNNQRMEKS